MPTEIKLDKKDSNWLDCGSQRVENHCGRFHNRFAGTAP
jgi:hypothetical protein